MRHIALASVSVGSTLCLAAEDIVKVAKQAHSRLKTVDKWCFACDLLNSATDAPRLSLLRQKNQVYRQELHISLLLFSHFPSFCCCVIIFSVIPPLLRCFINIFHFFFTTFPTPSGAPLPHHRHAEPGVAAWLCGPRQQRYSVLVNHCRKRWMSPLSTAPALHDH